MKKMIIISLAIFMSASTFAEPIVKTSNGLGGVSYSKIESRDLDEDELQSVRMKATIDISVNTYNVHAHINKPVIVRSTHKVCFSTFLTTNAQYNFVLDIGGQQTSVHEKIVIPARQNTCVTKQLYKQVTFPSAANFAYSATSTGYTMLTGTKRAYSSSDIFVK